MQPFVEIKLVAQVLKEVKLEVSDLLGSEV